MAPLIVAFLLLLLLHSSVWLGLTVSLTAISVGIVRKVLQRAGLFDTPNARSNHIKPIVRGGGLGMLLVVLPLGGVFGVPLLLLLTTALLALACFVDDVRPLPSLLRLAAQTAAVLVLFTFLPALHPLTLLMPYVTHLSGWMVWPVGAFALLAWLWWINAFNFMDGIDGIAAMESASIALGVLMLATFLPGIPAHVPLFGGVLLAAALGFMVWNWHPARIFLGDCGSVPLGLLTGYLLWQIVAAGGMCGALLLPAYYVVDATSTLLLRAHRRERLTDGHSCHAYQRAVRAGLRHDQVVGRIALLNLLLLVLALLTRLYPAYAEICVLGGYAATFLLWLRLGGGWAALRAPLQPGAQSRKEQEDAPAFPLSRGQA